VEYTQYPELAPFPELAKILYRISRGGFELLGFSIYIAYPPENPVVILTELL
jgi:hypothetical protein